MKHSLKKIFIFIFSFVICSESQARDVIRIAGSSSIYPIITIVAEEFSYEYGKKVPIVESVGTGAGFKLFCAGVGDNYTDIATASRKIKKSEIELCNKHGIKSINFHIMGYDGIVFVSQKNTKFQNFTLDQLFEALTNKKTKNWNQINSKLNNESILFYGPDKTSGNYDILLRDIVEPLCQDKIHCSIRNDGLYVESGSNQNQIIMKVLSNENSVGILPYAYYLEHSDELNLIKIDGILPSYETIKNKKYKLSRELLLYFKNEHFELVPDLKYFFDFIKSNKVRSQDGLLSNRGIILE